MSARESKEIDFDKLRFIRVFTPMHVPKELIEQVRDRTYEVEDWYKYQEIICIRQTPSGPQLNPLSLLYVIADEENKVIGMLWCEIDTLGKTLVIQTFSMDKKYWSRGKAVALLAKKGKEIAKECKLKSISWMTAYPRHSERYGFKRARQTHMEWKKEEEEEDGKNDDGECIADRTSALNDAGTTGLSSTDTAGAGTTSGTGLPAVSAAI